MYVSLQPFFRRTDFIAYSHYVHLQICEMISQGATVKRIDDQQVPYLVKGDQWVGYDDPQSIKDKVS